MDKIIYFIAFVIIGIASIIFAAIFILYCLGKLIAVWLMLLWDIICAPYIVFKVAITSVIPVIQDAIEQNRKSNE